MARKFDDLFGCWANFSALCAGARRAVSGKRKKASAAAFIANLERECLRLERELRDGRWRPGGYVSFQIHEPKPRHISAAPFRDRVVHQALCSVIEPLFEGGFIAHSYANRLDKGTHRAIVYYEKLRDRHRYVLRADIFRYFPAIDHEILKRDLRRRIACEKTLSVLDAIVDGANPQEPVNIYYPGDDLFVPFARRRGLPIGNLTSQLFANIYLDCLDHFVTEVLHAPYLRYVDDFALFADDVEQLAEWRERIATFLCGRRLMLHPKKTWIAPTEEPATFLGLVLVSKNYRRLPEDNVRRFRNRLRRMRDRWRSGTIDKTEVAQRIGSWVGHASHANTWRLRQAIFRGGWFDPTNRAPRKPGGLRHAPGVSTAAAAGTITPATRARPIATGTPLETATTISVSVSPVRS